MRKFLASVGNAKLLGKQNGTIYHIADVRTLTESTLSFSNTQEEVRAGEGAKLYGRFSHDSGMTCTLTDAMFDLNYIALQVGATISGNATAFFGEEKDITSSQESLTLSKTAQPIGNACGLDAVLAWVREKGCGADVDWKALPVEGNAIDVSDYQGKSICIQYFVDKPEARMLSVSANFIPAELILILTTKLFAGDANAPETGKPVGEITVKISRFSLDGNFDLSMAMSSAASISLAGTALAVDDGTCEGNGIYAEIVEVETGSTSATGLKEIIIDEDTLVVGAVPGVYGLYADGHISAISDYSVTPALNDGKFAANTYTFTVGGISDTVTIS